MTRLRIPALLPVLLLGLGGLFCAAAGRGLLTGGARAWSTLLLATIGLPLVAIGLTWTIVRVDLDEAGVSARSLRGRRRWAWAELKGIKLDQGEGRPRLLIHPREGEPVGYPAWSLRATADGEAEPARAALARICAERGVPFRSRSVLDGRRT